MNKKNIWYIVPILILPYLIVGILSVALFGKDNPFGKINPLGILLLCIMLTTIFSVIYFIKSIVKKDDPELLAKRAMIVKLVHVPAYIMIFILGICFMITIFTIPFTIGLFLIDSLILFLSSLLTISSVINGLRTGILKIKDIIWVVILQFVFCADVVVAVIYYLKIKRVKGAI